LEGPCDGYDSYFFDAIGFFHGYYELSLSNVISFIKVMNESRIVHEDVWMHTFLCTFEDQGIDWFRDDIGIAPI
jgi:hypothetical protein